MIVKSVYLPAMGLVFLDWLIWREGCSWAASWELRREGGVSKRSLYRQAVILAESPQPGVWKKNLMLDGTGCETGVFPFDTFSAMLTPL